MEKITNRYYFTLADLIKTKKPIVIPYPYKVPFDTFGGFITRLVGENVIANESTELTKLWTDYLWYTYNDAVAIYYDVDTLPWEDISKSDITSTELQPTVNTWVGKVLRWVNQTSERYLPIIQSWEEVKADLLKSIESENLVIYNDVPQNAGNWVDDPYATNTTKTTSKQDIATPMERLNEIESKIKSYYGAWANEFRALMIGWIQ